MFTHSIRRGLVIGSAALTATALALTGCGRSNDAPEAGAKATTTVSEGPATGNLTVWAMGTEGEKLAAFAKQFTDQNPGATVQVTAVPWDAAHQKIASAIAAKQTPDVSMIGTTDQGEFAKTGALDPTPTGLFHKQDFFPGAWDTTVVDGTSFAVPWYVETRGVYYRTDLAAEAGFPDGPKTWDDLKNMAKAMQTRAGAQWGIYLQPGKTGSWQSVLPFAWSAGADVAAGGKYTFDTPQMVEGLTYYQSFFRRRSHRPRCRRAPWNPRSSRGASARSCPGRGTSASSPTRAAPASRTSTRSHRCPPASRRRRSSAAPTSPCSRTLRTATPPGSSSPGCPARRPRCSGTGPYPTCPPCRRRGTTRR
jgi:multiple sugar transport system substrate-binding protein